MTMADAPSPGWPDQPIDEAELASRRGERSSSERGMGAREQIRQVRDQVVDHTRNTFRQAKDRATSSLDESRREAADQIGGLASAVHRTGEHLRMENQSRIAELTESVAEQVDHVARYVRSTDLRGVGRDLENLARRQPALVYGVAFAAGLAAARFLKSSQAEPALDGEHPARLASIESRESAGGFDARS